MCLSRGLMHFANGIYIVVSDLGNYKYEFLSLSREYPIIYYHYEFFVVSISAECFRRYLLAINGGLHLKRLLSVAIFQRQCLRVPIHRMEDFGI